MNRNFFGYAHLYNYLTKICWAVSEEKQDWRTDWLTDELTDWLTEGSKNIPSATRCVGYIIKTKIISLQSTHKFRIYMDDLKTVISCETRCGMLQEPSMLYSSECWVYRSSPVKRLKINWEGRISISIQTNHETII